MTQNAVYIASIDAKDLYLSNHYTDGSQCGYNIRTKDGNVNLRRFVNTLDYSLDLIKLREVYERVYRRINFSWLEGDKEYTQRVINVTFKYSVKKYNRVGGNIYVQEGYNFQNMRSEMSDSVVVRNGELIAIQVGVPVLHPLPDEVLGKYFWFEDGKYNAKQNIKNVVSVAQLRQDIYENGFWCDGIKYVRFKRSSGSSRVGKCLFIDEKLYPQMHKWECCGIKATEGQDIDLAAFEAYIALTLSSIIDTIEIDPENILLVDDYESTFYDDVVATRIGPDGHLVSREERVQVTNSIWDGQSLIDCSLLGEYSQYGMVLLRNRFFKSCCFNTNIQQFFRDHGITELDQLHGQTLATSVEDIKLITTPSSIKYLKFGTFREWLKNLEPLFGVVKHDKKTHFFNGQMVQTHYQLINTLQLSKDDMAEFMQPSMQYLHMLDTDPAVLRLQVKYVPDKEYRFPMTAIESKNDVVYKMIGLNEEFCQTKLYADFKADLIRAYKGNLKCGHVLVNGNYSTLLGNPYEMLCSTIGQFDGQSHLGVGNVFSLRFKNDQDLLLCRSPHCTMGNLCVEHNVYDEKISKYFNLTEEIICLNSINENILSRLSGCDFDSDTVMVTDNPILLTAAKKNYHRFRVPTCFVESKKRKRQYNSQQKADLDIKTSVNKIGEIINLSQELNTRLWDALNTGREFTGDLEEMYCDIALLDVLSMLEIDRAKKEFAFDNAEELRILCVKYHVEDKNGKMVKPNFFAHISKRKGYYNPARKNYKKHHTSMDYLQSVVNSFRCVPHYGPYKKFVDILDDKNYSIHKVKYDQVNRVYNLIRDSRKKSKEIWSHESIEPAIKSQRVNELRQECISYIGNIRFSYSTIYYILASIERERNKDIKNIVFSTLFGVPNISFYQAIRQNKRRVSELWQNDYGNIDIYGMKFGKVVAEELLRIA